MRAALRAAERVRRRVRRVANAKQAGWKNPEAAADLSEGTRFEVLLTRISESHFFTPPTNFPAPVLEAPHQQRSLLPHADSDSAARMVPWRISS